ncbi:hypothetical protein E2320_007178, partial [Naja naja]
PPPPSELLQALHPGTAEAGRVVRRGGAYWEARPFAEASSASDPACARREEWLWLQISLHRRCCVPDCSYERKTNNPLSYEFSLSKGPTDKTIVASNLNVASAPYKPRTNVNITNHLVCLYLSGFSTSDE